MNQILLFLGTPEDKEHMYKLKPMVGTSTVYTLLTPVSTLAEVVLYCQKRNITGVFTTSKTILEKLVATIRKPKKDPSIDSYAGSYFKYQGIEFVIIHPLDLMNKVPHMKMLTHKFVSKLVRPEDWIEYPKFEWTLWTPDKAADIEIVINTSDLISVDIETTKENLAIKCISYTCVQWYGKDMQIKTFVVPCDSSFNLSWIRKYNASPPPKIFQNGQYDNSYLLRYNAVIHNYLWDTATMFHCWYSELPKDLGFLFAFLVRDAMYWKDLSDTDNLMEYYEYNARDTYGTALSAIAWFILAPQWAKDNYVMEFPVNFPCLLAGMTGIKRDEDERKRREAEITAKIDAGNISLSKMVGTYPAIFNTNSTPQNAALRKILGCEDIKSSDAKVGLPKIAKRHPLNARIVSKIVSIRELRKLNSTYLCEGKELNERILYNIYPHGTDTGRCSSNESAFWCGLQVHNIPQGDEVKSTLVADEGFRIAECDFEQAESRDTAYVSGDSALIAAVSGERDFHSTNASAFFGVPYDEIYSDVLSKVLNKALRNLAKRVNHGANYLMGPHMLLETMGDDNVWEAKKLLIKKIIADIYADLVAKRVFNPADKAENAYRSMGLIEVCEYLLAQFHKTYPSLSAVFYPGVVTDVMTKQMLVSATGWTRYCFGNPKENKLHKNGYVAHVPQNLNAMVLNKAFMKVFYEIAIHPDHSKNFKLLAQIHDSILFQFREGHEYLADMVRERMEIPVTIKGYDGITRTFTVPAAIKAGKDGKGAKRWSETE